MSGALARPGRGTAPRSQALARGAGLSSPTIPVRPADRLPDHGEAPLSYALMVAAVVAGFGLTAFCAAIFHIKNFWTLLGLVAAFGFGVPALISVLTIPDRTIPWMAIGLSLVLALAIVGVVMTARLTYQHARRRRDRREEADATR